MIRKLFVVGAIVCALQVAFVSGVFASSGDCTSTGYCPSGDTNLSLSTGTGLLSGVNTGSTLFNTQESVYSTTDTSVQHDYLNVYVDGGYVLGIDPPCIY